MELILASGSPRRLELLQLLDRPFRVVKPDIVEQQREGETPVAYVERLAREKALAGAQLCVSERPEQVAVLGADTVVVCADRVLEKPSDKADFEQMMALLSGRAHQAVTAVALHHNGATASRVVTTTVHFKTLNTDEINAYWHSGEPQDKAGGYGIQGRAGKFVTHIEGSYLAVVGLPLYETEQLLVNLEATLAKDEDER